MREGFFSWLGRDFGELLEENQRAKLAWERKLAGEEGEAEEGRAVNFQA